VNGWTSTERGLRDALCDAILPGDAESGLPPLSELDLEPFWGELRRAAPPLLGFGLRAIVWALTLLPLLILRVPRTFGDLDAVERQRFLERAAQSSSFLVRQMVLTLKTVACLAYLHDPKVRAIVDARSRHAADLLDATRSAP
jgi:hypothetical protein